MASHNSLVEFLGVASKPSEGVEVAVLLGELFLLEALVAVHLGVGHLVVEHAYLVPIQYFYRAIFIVRDKRGVVEAPVIVVEHAEADAGALAGRSRPRRRGKLLLGCLLGFFCQFSFLLIKLLYSTETAINAVFDSLALGSGLLVDLDASVVAVVGGRPVQQHPSTGKA